MSSIETTTAETTLMSKGATPMPRSNATILAALIAVVLLLGSASQAHADFGIVDFDGAVSAADGSTYTQAGGHPDSVTTEFSINTTTAPDGYPAIDEDNIKDAVVSLPAGLVGNPQALPRCELADFYTTTIPNVEIAGCPDNAAVGYMLLDFLLGGGGGMFRVQMPTPIYNLEPGPSRPARFGAALLTTPIVLEASVRTGDDYGVDVSSPDTSQALQLVGAAVTFWGTPADPAHDSMRGGCAILGGDCPAGVPPRPLLRLPTSCQDSQLWKLRLDRWNDPGNFHHASFVSHDTAGDPVGTTGCDQLDFSPSLSAQPTTNVADSPSGLSVRLDMPQNDLVGGLAEADLKQATIELPEGMAVNPSSADGLGACTPAEIDLEGPASPSCPADSKIGTVEIDTPLLADPLEGAVYLASQGTNPFDSLLALYIVAEGQGVVVKLAGKVEPDPDTGQLQASFTNNPQLPFSELRLDLKGGSRAPLVTPPRCGTFTTRAELSSWSAADPDNPTDDEIVTNISTFDVDSGPNGLPCAASEQDRPFDPAMNAGLENAMADSSSPFNLRLTRPDGNQELGSLSLAMPEGVTAKLAGVEYCPDATLAAISNAEGTGQGELDSPSCPANSQVGVATVGAGAGSAPLYVSTGKAYLAGPYKGAQLSLAVVVPALAGPFDLGTEVVRSKLNVDKRTAQVSVESDPLPQILHGIPLKIRDLRVNVNRDGFMRSPTNCDPMEVRAEVQGSHGATASLTNRFQVGDCASLGFSPDLDLSFGNSKKNTKANSHPPLNAKLSFNEGDSNISSVEVALPQGLFLDQDRLGRICSRANYAAETCPEESVVGYAKATTPLLDNPVEGPVYLKASDNPLPDLAADLNGQIDVDLFGKIDQKQNKKGLNQIRNTFDIVPDVPVSDFELKLDGGADGLLVNSRNICKSKKAQKVSIDMVAHNEMTSSSKPLIGSACKQLNKKKAKKLKAKAKKLLKKAKKADNSRKAKQLRKQARKLKRQARKLGR